MQYLTSVSIPLDSERSLSLLIAEDTLSHPESGLRPLPELRDGWLGRTTGEDGKDVGRSSAAIHYDSTAPERGLEALALKENIRYYCTLRRRNREEPLGIRSDAIRSSLQKAKGTEWRPKELSEWPGPTLQFKVSGYLGTAWLEVKGYGRIGFEVKTEKIGYETEFRSMVESIATYCHQLLLEWSTPTAFSFQTDPAKKKQTLLEQFLFLRHSLAYDELDLYLEMIRRNPHRRLVCDETWMPTGLCPSKRIFRQPLRYGRDWFRSDRSGSVTFSGFLPRQVLCQHKFDTVDTPPNRFVRFTLEYFRSICSRVISHPQIEGAAANEARAMRDSLDRFLLDPFFRNVSALTRVPIDNPTLQRGEGYRQILQSWLLVRASAQLDWEGRKDAYDGNNRDVATLYEYWLYFVLYRILVERLQLSRIEVGATEHSFPVFQNVSGGLRISLQGGKESFSAFSWAPDTHQPLRVHLFYKRYFPSRATTPDVFVGAYSRSFWPDYTLVIFPEQHATGDTWHDDERRAAEAGQISYLHFDAKYRVKKLKETFGASEESDDPSTVKAEVREEQRTTKTTNTYRRADLYKMHTYAEAIRRTVGSYVLYPGIDEACHYSAKSFRRYHEILPGVGAFVLRPVDSSGPSRSSNAAGEDVLAEFLADVLSCQQSRCTELYRIEYWRHHTVTQSKLTLPCERGLPLPEDESLPAPDIMVLVSPLSPQANRAVENAGIYWLPMPSAGQEIDPALLQARYFVGHYQGTPTGAFWSIGRWKVYPATDLVDRLGSYPSLSVGPSHYLVAELAERYEMGAKTLTNIVDAETAFVASWDRVMRAAD